jgi:hypothetical protein
MVRGLVRLGCAVDPETLAAAVVERARVGLETARAAVVVVLAERQ